MNKAPLLAEITDEFRKLKENAEKAIVQLDDAELFARIDADANSVSVIMRHMAGNLVSRFRDFLTTDGEKPDRDRDGEFVERAMPRDELLATWNRGWGVLFDTLATLSDGDLKREVLIRREPHTVFRALTRQLTHHAYHVGQIVLIAKHIRGARWNYITIPRGQSQAFNRSIGV